MTPVDLKPFNGVDESVWIEIKLKGRDKLLLGCVYRSPNSDSVNDAKLLSGLKKTCVLKRYSHFLICGDFNLPEIDWKRNTTSTSQNHIAYLFKECINDCYLVQHVHEPTHHRAEQKANVLDLVLSNEEGMVSGLELGAPIGASHHSSILFKFNCYQNQEKRFKKIFKYNRGNYDKLREMMSVHNWEILLENKKCEEAWEIFYELIIVAMKKCIPLGTNKGRKPGRALWMNDQALKKVKKKTEAFKRYLNSEEGGDYAQYAKARNQARWECRKMKRDFEKKIAAESKSNPKAFYRYANSKLKIRSGIADLDTDNGKASTNAEKAELLNSFFISVFTRENVESMPLITSSDIEPISNLVVTEESVQKKLMKLNPCKSSGPDELHPKVLKELSHVISKPLAMIMQMSLNEGTLPRSWKDAHVTPIFKKGKKSKTTNYRPVSLTSVVCKTLESIIKDHVVKHVQENKVLTECQHGFVSGRSCSTQLIACLDIWTSILDQGSNVDAVYLDFSKAFDSVPHQRLCKKLESYGISGNTLNWIKDFLNDRRQKVIVNGEESQWQGVLSGVPQGSVIGPLLFIIFINDMPETCSSFIQMFADDAKVFAEVNCDMQNAHLQQDLDSLQIWANNWQLVFNAKKCKVMHLGKGNNKYDYYMGGETLEKVQNEKDLGVLVDDQLRFDTHIENQVMKANKILGLIRRSFTCLDKSSFCTLYKSIVRTHLEYANAVTYPQFEKESKLLEEVQRRATKQVAELKDLSYTDRLKALKLPSLLYRRKRGDMIEVFKYCCDLYSVNPSPLHLDEGSVTRGHKFKLYKDRAEKSTRQKFFSHRVINDWNSLPAEIVDSPTLNSFKNRLDKHWSDKFYEIPNM